MQSAVRVCPPICLHAHQPLHSLLDLPRLPAARPLKHGDGQVQQQARHERHLHQTATDTLLQRRQRPPAWSSRPARPPGQRTAAGVEKIALAMSLNVLLPVSTGPCPFAAV